jgi:hypothetical protein
MAVKLCFSGKGADIPTPLHPAIASRNVSNSGYVWSTECGFFSGLYIICIYHIHIYIEYMHTTCYNITRII